MLLTIATSLVAIWAIAIATAHPLGGWVHVALFFAGVAAIVRFLNATSQSYANRKGN